MTSARASSPVLELVDLCVSFGKGQREALSHVTLTLEAGRLVLVGESGAGKSTLLRTIAGLLSPSQGAVRVRGVDPFAGSLELARVRRSLGVVLQEPRSSLHPMRSALDSVAEPLIVLGALSRKEALRRAAVMLEQVNIDSGRFLGHPAHLSGGECQRVALARALIRPVSLLLADEATANLDPHLGVEIVHLVSGMTMASSTTPSAQPLPSLVWVTHRLHEALTLGGTTAVLWGGRVVELFTDLRSWDQALHPYTRRLVDPKGMRSHQACSVREDGCTYRPLCYLGADCRYQTSPVLKLVAPNHAVACWKVEENRD